VERQNKTMQNAHFISEPQLVARHSDEQSFIGQAIVQLKDNSLLMIVPTGRAPADFEDRDCILVMPRVFRSNDNGRSWQDESEIDVEWNVPGMACGGGMNLHYLRDGRLLLIMHRRIKGFHGGGVPVFTSSGNHGKTWQPVQTLIPDDNGVYYVMNDRLTELHSGRLIIPAAVQSLTMKDYYEGGICDSCCFYSDDLGKTWQLNAKNNRITLPDDPRGMAEPSIAELSDGSILMLARTGKGCLYSTRSFDQGETWSIPEPTSLTSPCSSLTMRKMSDGRLIVFYNHVEPLEATAFFPRNPLTYAISGDDGLSWSEPVLIDNGGHRPDENHRQHIYPSICFTAEGLLLAYSTHPASPDGQFKSISGRIPGGIKVALVRVQASLA
jgi:BNR repeat protein